MEAKTIWLFVFVGLYWAYCLFWGIKGALMSKTATDYMIAGRGLSVWLFVLAATATSFSGWTFIGHPGLLYRDGFQYAYASFYAITIPFSGMLFLKRQWMLGKRYGFVTPGEMLSAYLQSNTLRLLTVLVALVFSIPYVGVQLRASGFLFNVLTNGMLSVNVGMWLLSAVLAIYVVSGGLRAVAYVDVAQCILLALGIVIIGIIAYAHLPEAATWRELIGTLTQEDANRTPQGYSHYIAVPGVIQFVSDGPKATGGVWTGIMILTYMFALMGIQSSPAFSMWAFSNKSPAPFPYQQVWASSFVIGFILFVFTAVQGIGGHFLGADLKFLQAHPDLVNPVLQEGLVGISNPDADSEQVATAISAGLANLKAGQGSSQLVDIMSTAAKQENLVPSIIHLMSDTLPWLVGLLAVCALAAMESTAAPYMSTAGSILTRDVLRRYIMPNATDLQQKFWGRMGTIAIVLVALVVATTSTDALVLLGGLAVAYGFQMWPALIAVCYWPWLTRQGILWGLIAGLLAVTLTDTFGQSLFAALGIDPPWGRWPWTIHSAGWGIIFNLSLAILISALTQNREAREHRQQYHKFLREHAALPAHKRPWIPLAWLIALAWFFFAIGPGAMIGNWAFGDPNRPETWLFGIPSIWTWQILWWFLGVLMMWFLAFKMELSTVPERQIEELVDVLAAQPTVAKIRR